MTATIIEHETIELPDLDAVRACDWVEPECDQEVTHRLRATPCGCNSLLCTEHAAIKREEMGQLALWSCGDCGKYFGFGPASTWLKIEPV